MKFDTDWDNLVVAESLRLNIVKGRILGEVKRHLSPHQYRAFIRARRISSLDAIALINLARSYGESVNNGR